MAELSSKNDSERAWFRFSEWMLECWIQYDIEASQKNLRLCFWTYGFLVYDSVGQIFGSNNAGWSNSNKESWVEATRLGKCDWCVYDDLWRRFFEALPPKLASKKPVFTQQRSCNSLRFEWSNPNIEALQIVFSSHEKIISSPHEIYYSYSPIECWTKIRRQS